MEAPILQEYGTEMLYALHFYLHEVFLDQKIFLILINSSTWKSIFFQEIGASNVTKHHSSHLAKVELDRQGKRFSEHVADAYHIGKIGWWFYRWHFEKTLKDEDLPERIRDFFCGKKTYVRGEKKGITEYYGLIYRENEYFIDFSKQTRNVESIKKEIQDGGENDGKKEGCAKAGLERQRDYDSGRIL